MSVSKPARRFIAEARELRDHDQTFWGAYWAFPGMVPAWVISRHDDLPMLFDDKDDATAMAKLTLASALLKRLTTTDKPERYRFQRAADFAADLREAGITPTQFARVYGTTQENVVTNWIGGLRPVPYPASVLLALFLVYPDAIEVAEQVTADNTTPRHQFAEEEVSS